MASLAKPCRWLPYIAAVSFLLTSLFSKVVAFQSGIGLFRPPFLADVSRHVGGKFRSAHETPLYSTTSDDSSTSAPQVFASGYSTNADLVQALQEAVEMAVQSLPPGDQIDLCFVSVSSLYDGGAQQPATVVVPALLETAASTYGPIQHIVGSSAAGCISSEAATDPNETCEPVEWESIPAVSVTLALLPNVHIQTFNVQAADVPDDYGRLPPAEWKRAVGLSDLDEEDPVFFLLPNPSFQTDIDDLLQGLSTYFPNSHTFGGIASTVSSLSRAKLYRYSVGKQEYECLTDGCVGVALAGDVKIQTLSAQGAKPVGGIYQILKGQDSTIQVIVLDEAATAALEEEEEQEDDEEEEDKEVDAKARAAQAYAKAQIPKPPLAEANFIMRTLSDDDQAFMRRQLLVGLEQGGSVGRTASELARLAEGQGHRFTVLQVASAGMKDGSVTLPLGSVDVTAGTRMRFFVREPEFAKKEVEALWIGYKKRLLSEQFENDQVSFTPAGCFVIPTLDRGSKFFLGKQGYESSAVARILPGVPCVTGFFSNGIIGPMNVEEGTKNGVQGSASGYTLIGSKSGRPIYSPAVAAAEKAALEEQQAKEEADARAQAAEDRKRDQRTKRGSELDQKAPRSEDGELIIKRREVHSGRALTVSTVEWSVAEKTANPTSKLEGYMWDKETEVDRQRERIPLANLVSQCRLSLDDPKSPKPRNFSGAIKQAADKGDFVVIPECKRTEPTSGSLRRRYDLEKIVRDFTLAGAAAISVNCDAVLFGGSMEDVTKARATASKAAIEGSSEDGVVVPPILASDLLLYPYQIYKLRLAGADAVNIVTGALATKDLSYLVKIASSLKMQTFLTVTSEVQLRSLSDLPTGSFDGVIVSNRELEDFSFDMTGEQALALLRSEALKDLRKVHGDDLLVLVEGRVGIIERPDKTGEKTAKRYMEELKEAGAIGAIVGGGLVVEGSDSLHVLETNV